MFKEMFGIPKEESNEKEDFNEKNEARIDELSKEYYDLDEKTRIAWDNVPRININGGIEKGADTDLIDMSGHKSSTGNPKPGPELDYFNKLSDKRRQLSYKINRIEGVGRSPEAIFHKLHEALEITRRNAEVSIRKITSRKELQDCGSALYQMNNSDLQEYINSNTGLSPEARGYLEAQIRYRVIHKQLSIILETMHPKKANEQPLPKGLSQGA